MSHYIAIRVRNEAFWRFDFCTGLRSDLLRVSTTVLTDNPALPCWESVASHTFRSSWLNLILANFFDWKSMDEIWMWTIRSCWFKICTGCLNLQILVKFRPLQYFYQNIVIWRIMIFVTHSVAWNLQERQMQIGACMRFAGWQTGESSRAVKMSHFPTCNRGIRIPGTTIDSAI